MTKETCNSMAYSTVSFPTEWSIEPFQDILSEPIRNGIYKKKEFHGRGYKVVNMGELFAYDYITDQDMKRIELTDDELGKYSLIAGDLLFARRSLVLEGAGKCSIVVNPTEETVFESSIIRARLNRDIADPHYYYHFFRSPQGRALMASIATRTAVSGIRGSNLMLLKVPRPPLMIQTAIAHILSRYDDLIENNTRRIKILEEMARLIYREWFVKFRFPGHENVKMVESELGMIPEGWGVKRLGELAESVRRSVKPGEMEPSTPYVGLEHIPRKSIALTEWATFDTVNSTKLCFREREILFGKIRPYFHKVVFAPLPGICSSDTMVIRPKNNRDFSLALSCVSSTEFVEHSTQTSQGTKMPRANWDVLVNYPIPYAPSHIRDWYTNFIENIVSEIQNRIFSNRNLRETRDLLLPKLISGELDVEEAEIIWRKRNETSA